MEEIFFLKRVSKRQDEYKQIEENVVNDDEEDVDECQWQSQKSTERGIGLKVFLILFSLSASSSIYLERPCFFNKENAFQVSERSERVSAK
jgi:hypothetical protein